MEHSVHELIKHISQKLCAHYHDAVLADQYAWWMVEEVTQRTKTELLLHDAFSISATQHEKLEQWIHAQVVDHEPLAYLIGWVPFMDFRIKCRPPTLIPRPETEEWCTKLIEILKKPLKTSGRTEEEKLAEILKESKSSVRPEVLRDQSINSNRFKILDLCTGSGCIAIALAKAFPTAQIIATDISDSALELAQENATINKVSNITFIKSDVYKSLSSVRPEALEGSEKFDLIVSNPPYIAPEEWKSLDTSVTKWEDSQALAAPDHGLAILKKIISGADQWLNNNALPNAPQLVVEIGYQQGPAVKELMKAAGFERVEIKKDLAGKDRTAWGTCSELKRSESIEL